MTSRGPLRARDSVFQMYAKWLGLLGVNWEQIQFALIFIVDFAWSCFSAPTPLASFHGGFFPVCFRSILEKEGPRSLFRGLGPNLVGVAPSR